MLSLRHQQTELMTVSVEKVPLEAVCDRSSMCNTSGSECRRGRCICPPGTYHVDDQCSPSLSLSLSLSHSYGSGSGSGSGSGGKTASGSFHFLDQSFAENFAKFGLRPKISQKLKSFFFRLNSAIS